MRTIKLMADYDCWPLWEASPGEVGNIDPDELPISTQLKERLTLWAAEYDATLVRDDPARSGFATPEAEAAFSAAGLRLGEELQADLGPAYRVIVRVPQWVSFPPSSALPNVRSSVAAWRSGAGSP